MFEIVLIVIVLSLYLGYLLFLLINHSKVKRLNLEVQLSNNRLLEELDKLNSEHTLLLKNFDLQNDNHQKLLNDLESELIEKIVYIERLIESNDGLLLELKEQKMLNKNLTDISIKLQNDIARKNNS